MLARLQFSLGKAAVIRGELPAIGGCLRFAAHGPDDDPSFPPTRVVVLHPEAPEGPTAGALLDRMASIRTVASSSIAPLMATGEFEGRAWVVEPAPRTATVGDRVAAGEKLAVEEVVRLMRESARALAGLHRRNLTHGALTPSALCATPEQVAVNRLGTGFNGTVDGDLSALGEVAQLALIGAAVGDEARGLREIRPSVPEALEALISNLTTLDSPDRPKSAAAVLTALDAFAGPSPARSGGAMEVAEGGGRSHTQTENLKFVLGVGLAVLVVWMLVRFLMSTS